MVLTCPRSTPTSIPQPNSKLSPVPALENAFRAGSYKQGWIERRASWPSRLRPDSKEGQTNGRAKGLETDRGNCTWTGLPEKWMEYWTQHELIRSWNKDPEDFRNKSSKLDCGGGNWGHMGVYWEDRQKSFSLGLFLLLVSASLPWGRGGVYRIHPAHFHQGDKHAGSSPTFFSIPFLL